MADSLPKMYAVAVEVLDDHGLWQNAKNWFAADDMEDMHYAGEHVDRGGTVTHQSRTISAPQTLEEVMEEAEKEKHTWIRAGLHPDRIRISKTQFRGKGKNINEED